MSWLTKCSTFFLVLNKTCRLTMVKNCLGFYAHDSLSSMMMVTECTTNEKLKREVRTRKKKINKPIHHSMSSSTLFILAYVCSLNILLDDANSWASVCVITLKSRMHGKYFYINLMMNRSRD